MYSHGVQEYYTVEAILYFYTQLVIQHLSYENYLRLTARHDKQAVRQADQQAGVNLFYPSPLVLSSVGGSGPF
jgi:hypothetical protein